MVSESDVTLIEAIAQRRDRDAFTQLFERHQHAAYSLSRHITGNAQAAEEAVQEAMLQVWLSASTFESRGSVRGWILRIVAQKSLRTIRVKQKERSDIKHAAEMRPDSVSPSVTESGEHEEVLTALRRVLGELPALDQQIVAMHFGGGLTQEEIGAALATPQRTVSFRIAKALEGIRAGMTRAGFAAAMPMLMTEHLNNALCSGSTLPTAVSQQIVSRTFSVRPSIVRTLAQGKAAVRGGSWLIGSSVAAVAAAGAVIVWWMLQGSGSTAQTTEATSPPASSVKEIASHDGTDAPAPRISRPTPAPVAVPVATATAPTEKSAGPENGGAAKPANAAADLKDVVWNFADGPARDLEVLDGDWKWELVNIHTGHMIVPEENAVIVRLPMELPPKPVVIKIRLTSPLGIWYATAYWLGGTNITPHTYYPSKLNRFLVPKKGLTPRELNLYFIDRYIAAETVLDVKPEITLVREYPKPPTSRRVGLYFKNVGVDEISVHYLRPDEITDSLRNLKHEADRLGDPTDIKDAEPTSAK